MRHRWRQAVSRALKRSGAGSWSENRFCLLLEAFLWTIGYLLGQGFILVGLVALFLTAAYGLHWPDRDSIISLILETDLDRSFLLVGATSLGVILLLIPAIRLREGREFRERIGWRYPCREEIVYSLATVIPIAMLGDLIYDASSAWWQGARPVWPFAAALRESSLEHLYSTFQGVPYHVLIVAMALGPAIGEELVFRGILGRRLVARFGLPVGACLSAICFAAAHGSPPHAIATLPVGVLLQVLYTQTRTIWVPILVHFCNNLLAISLVRFQLATDAPQHPLLIISLSVYMTMILLLMRTRRNSWIIVR
ncbi:CPBP family intramembrane glutamic endopeptidase [Planctomicrobium sp. SH664]|uniref:CPBP family intramembrane glutamic endopeptidase n=1 Tax=Planctomicrobium sp. SH664 TaxID=3448125 RepID=UPI003F5B7156